MDGWELGLGLGLGLGCIYDWVCREVEGGIPCVLCKMLCLSVMAYNSLLPFEL